MKKWMYKVFTDRVDLGNPVVVVEDEGWSEGELLQIAGQSAAPVTVFLSPSDLQEHHRKFRFFSKVKELSFCGHGTLGAGTHLMHILGLNELSIETISSVIRLTRPSKDYIYFEAPRASLVDVQIDQGEIALMLGISVQDLDVGAPLCAASIGSPKLLVPVCSTRALDSIQPDQNRIAAWSETHGINGIFVYTLGHIDKNSSPVSIHARSFNPLFGIYEDAATGVAAGALADVLHTLGWPPSFIFYQGRILGADSQMKVVVHSDKGHIAIGGSVVAFT